VKAMVNEQVTRELVEISSKKEIKSVNQIEEWLISYIAEMLDIKPEKVDITTLFEEYGLDSAMIIGMLGDLEVWLEYELDPTLVYDYSTIEDLAQHLGSF
jgi:acyl carrier protein